MARVAGESSVWTEPGAWEKHCAPDRVWHGQKPYTGHRAPESVTWGGRLWEKETSGALWGQKKAGFRETLKKVPPGRTPGGREPNDVTARPDLGEIRETGEFWKSGPSGVL